MEWGGGGLERLGNVENNNYLHVEEVHILLFLDRSSHYLCNGHGYQLHACLISCELRWARTAVYTINNHLSNSWAVSCIS